MWHTWFVLFLLLLAPPTLPQEACALSDTSVGKRQLFVNTGYEDCAKRETSASSCTSMTWPRCLSVTSTPNLVRSFCLAFPAGVGVWRRSLLRALHSSVSHVGLTFFQITSYYPHKFVMYCRCLHFTACPLQEEGGNCFFYCYFSALSSFTGGMKWVGWAAGPFMTLILGSWWAAEGMGVQNFVHLLSSSGDLDIMRQLGARNVRSYRFPWIEVSVQFVVSPHFQCTKCLDFVTMTALLNLVPPLFLKT